MDLTADGQLTIRFNKPILEPKIKINSPIGRRLRGLKDAVAKNSLLYDINEVVSLRVANAEDEDILDKHLCGVFLDEVDTDTLKMQVDFCTPNDLTKSIIDPDVLEIVFSLPSLIVDA